MMCICNILITHHNWITETFLSSLWFRLWPDFRSWALKIQRWVEALTKWKKLDKKGKRTCCVISETPVTFFDRMTRMSVTACNVLIWVVFFKWLYYEHCWHPDMGIFINLNIWSNKQWQADATLIRVIALWIKCNHTEQYRANVLQ